MIDEIGTWVLRTACTEAARWAALSPGRVPRVSINLSAHQLADPQFAWTVQAAMAHAGAIPSWVTLELTESMLMKHSSASLERLHAIRALGVQIAIDDFGTGYSSLAYLEQFPITHIKIDRSFVTPLDDPAAGRRRRPRDHRDRARARPDNRRRRDRDTNPAPAAARAGLRARPGLPLRPTPRAGRDGRPRRAEDRTRVRRRGRCCGPRTIGRDEGVQPRPGRVGRAAESVGQSLRLVVSQDSEPGTRRSRGGQPSARLPSASGHCPHAGRRRISPGNRRWPGSPPDACLSRSDWRRSRPGGRTGSGRGSRRARPGAR